jgi:hypothetical protein
MTFFARGWFDRLLGRGRSAGGEAAAERSEVLREREEARKPESTADLEEGATAARDDTTRQEPMPPPGTG